MTELFTPMKLGGLLRNGDADAIAYGKLYIANPDTDKPLQSTSAARQARPLNLLRLRTQKAIQLRHARSQREGGVNSKRVDGLRDAVERVAPGTIHQRRDDQARHPLRAVLA